LENKKTIYLVLCYLLKSKIMIKIYHNPRCKKSRAGLERLKTKTEDFEIIQYLKEGIDLETLKRLHKKLGIPAEDMIRKQEAVFKTNYKGKSLSDTEWLEAIIEEPKLLQRPIIETDNDAILADPAEKLDRLF